MSDEDIQELFDTLNIQVDYEELKERVKLLNKERASLKKALVTAKESYDQSKTTYLSQRAILRDKYVNKKQLADITAKMKETKREEYELLHNERESLLDVNSFTLSIPEKILWDCLSVALSEDEAKVKELESAIMRYTNLIDWYASEKKAYQKRDRWVSMTEAGASLLDRTRNYV